MHPLGIPALLALSEVAEVGRLADAADYDDGRRLSSGRQREVRTVPGGGFAAAGRLGVTVDAAATARISPARPTDTRPSSPTRAGT